MSCIRELGRACLDWFYPRLCIVCDCALLTEERAVCSHCSLQLMPCGYHLTKAAERLWSSPIFRQLYSLYTYQKEGACQRLIYSYKYQNNSTVAGLIAERARLVPGFELEHYDLILAIPLAPNRWQERNYNQSFLLAKAFSKFIPGIECSDDYILRKHQQHSQKHLGRLERRLMVQGVFYPNPSKTTRWANRRILLVDDVLTTGSTLLSYLSVLEALGAKEVDVFTICIAI